jgi:hypothetical protein
MMFKNIIYIILQYVVKRINMESKISKRFSFYMRCLTTTMPIQVIFYMKFSIGHIYTK